MRGLPVGLLILILAPVIEIWLMIDIGSEIGAGWTVFAIIATAIIGANLVRFQGLGVLNRMNQASARGELPAMEMIEGLGLFISGVLLLTPGFITDSFGFLLLIPPLRRYFALNIIKNFIVKVKPAGQTDSDVTRQKTSIEGEFRRIDK